MIQTAQAEEVDHYLLILQDLVWRILKGNEDFSSLKKRFGELFKQGYLDGLQLPKAYLALIAHLLHFDPLPLEPQQFPNGAALLDTMGWCESREIPEQVELAQLGVLWMILGVRLKNEMLQRAGLKIAVWHVHLLDGQGRPHLSAWARASSFRPSHLSLWNHVLFAMAYRLTGENGFHRLSEVARHQSWNPHTFPAALLVLVPSMMTPTVPNLYHPFAEEITAGIMKFSNPDISFMAHLSGWNSGLFSFHKREVAIVNGGPQAGAYDDLSRFGVRRTWGIKHRPFQEITWEKTVYHCHLKGWTQLSSVPLWMELDARLQAGRLTLETIFQEKETEEPLALALFMKCNKIVLGGKHHLEAGTLERYEGKALTLELQGASERMMIEPDALATMKVIPLAGGDYFWGADFLVAFPIDAVRKAFKIDIK